MINKCITIEDLQLSDKNLVKRIGQYGIYYRGEDNDSFFRSEIFRYIKLSYFFSMMDESILYIPNRKSFTDLRDKIGMGKYIPKYKYDFKIKPIDAWKDRKWRKELQEEKNAAMDVCISCWTKDTQMYGRCEESFLMWKAYSDSKELVCRIGTSVQLLLDSIIELPCDFVISKVEYTKENDHSLNGLLFNKTMYYSTEHEVRLVALSRGKDHMSLRIDPYKLVQNVKTSPFIPPLIENAVIEALKRKYVNLKDKIGPSEVMEYPHV